MPHAHLIDSRVRVNFSSYSLIGRVFAVTLVALIIMDDAGRRETCWRSDIKGIEKL